MILAAVVRPSFNVGQFFIQEEIRRRHNVAKFIIGKADVNSLTLSLNRQQEAQKNYISALQNYWLNYYKIRKLTLFDFERGLSLSDEFDFNNGLYR